MLSGVLPSDWPIQFIDAAINRLSPERTLAMVEQAKPDGIIMAMSSVVWSEDFAFLQHVRKSFPRVKLIIFGEVFKDQQFAQKALGYADGLIFDPLRSQIVEALEGKVSATATWIPAKKNNRELRIHIPRHDLFDNIRYRWPFVKHFRFACVFTQCGCPFVCSYCPESTTHVTYRPAENILEELDSIKSSGYRELHIGDASFGYPVENARRLLVGMYEKNYGFSWSAYVYPGLANATTLELMAKTGCHTVVIGIDSADGALLEKYGRRLAQGKIRDFISECRRNGIMVCGDLMLGFAEDDRDSCMRTVELAVELDLDYASFNIVSPMIGSSIREDYKKKGLISDESVGFETTGTIAVSATPNISPSELMELRSLAVRRFYLRPSYFLKRLKALRGPEDFLIQANEGYGVILRLIQERLKSQRAPTLSGEGF